jgi:hypothetical protein
LAKKKCEEQFASIGEEVPDVIVRANSWGDLYHIEPTTPIKYENQEISTIANETDNHLNNDDKKESGVSETAGKFLIFTIIALVVFVILILMLGLYLKMHKI